MARLVDPYQKPYEDLNRRLGLLASVFGKLNETGVSRLTPADRLKLEGDLKQHVSNAEWEVNDVEEGLSSIEANRSKFSNIPDDQIQERRAFVQRSKIYLQGIKSRMAGSGGSSAGHTAAHQQQSRETRSPAVNENLIDVDIYNKRSYPGGSASAPSFTNSIIHEQQQLLRHQDQHLDEIAGGVSLLKDMSQRIGNELDDQDVMLDDLGQDMEHSQRRIDTLLSRTQKVLRLSNDRRQWCAIIVLIVLLIIVVSLFFIM